MYYTVESQKNISRILTFSNLMISQTNFQFPWRFERIFLIMQNITCGLHSPKLLKSPKFPLMFTSGCVIMCASVYRVALIRNDHIIPIISKCFSQV